MVLIDGDPTARIEDIHYATLVIKGGNPYQPAQIETALGIAPKGCNACVARADPRGSAPDRR